MMSTFLACFLFGSVFGCVKGERVNVNAEINKPAILHCTVPIQVVDNTVYWYKNPNTLISAGTFVTTSYKRMSINHTHEREWNIHIERVHEEDAGEYTCRFGKKVMAHVYLVLKTPPMINWMSDVTFEEGGTGTVWCNATGFPTPSIRWYWKYPHQMDGIEHNTGAEGTRLVLHNITRYYDNIYVCKASNNFGTIRRESRVHVKFGPDVEVFQETVNATEGQEVTLLCAVEAYPMEGELEWAFENRVPIVADSKYGVETDRDLVKDFNTQFLSMIIRNLGDMDYGKYVCRTKNFSKAIREKVVVIQKP